MGCGLCQSMAGADRVRLRMNGERGERPVVLEPLDESTLASIDLKSYGDLTRATYAAYLDGRMHGFMSRWALMSLCSAYERQQNLIRDSATFHWQRKDRTQKQLEQLGRTVELQLYEGEGHGWRKVATVMDELARVEAFLRRHVLTRRS